MPSTSAVLRAFRLNSFLDGLHSSRSNRRGFADHAVRERFKNAGEINLGADPVEAEAQAA